MITKIKYSILKFLSSTKSTSSTISKSQIRQIYLRILQNSMMARYETCLLRSLLETMDTSEAWS